LKELKEKAKGKNVQNKGNKKQQVQNKGEWAASTKKEKRRG